MLKIKENQLLKYFELNVIKVSLREEKATETPYISMNQSQNYIIEQLTKLHRPEELHENRRFLDLLVDPTPYLFVMEETLQAYKAFHGVECITPDMYTDFESYVLSNHLQYLKGIKTNMIPVKSPADRYFKEALDDILDNGVDTRTLPCADVRTKWKDGEVAHYTYVTNKYFEYDLSEGYFPLISYRPQAWKSAIKEILWIYQDQSNELEILKDKHNITWWNAWESKDRPGTIGQRYGATIKKYDLMNKVLDALKTKGSNRRVIIDMLQYTDLEETDGLYPCAYSTTWNVRGEYLDMLLNQRSSDFLTAWSINQAQYAALLIMVATAVGLKPGKFSHMIGNLHIYDRHIEAAKEMSSRSINPDNYPKIEFEPDYRDFYSFKLEDFRLEGYHPNPEQIKLEIAE